MTKTLSTDTHLMFHASVGRQKPESIVNRNTACPFCDRSTLEDVLDEEGSIILLKNKYPVLADTFQTVLIETDECEGELSTYPRHHLHALLRFAIHHWFEMERSGDFRSVILYKNHGPLSGGTIRHPHMQIVGLKNVNYLNHVHPQQFEGIPIVGVEGLTFNISTAPHVGFFEFNVILENLHRMNQMADCIQIAAHYALHHFNKHCQSYNLFFYHVDHRICVKIVPRFVTSPLYVGFSIPQVSDRIYQVAEDIQRIYESQFTSAALS